MFLEQPGRYQRFHHEYRGISRDVGYYRDFGIHPVRTMNVKQNCSRNNYGKINLS